MMIKKFSKLIFVNSNFYMKWMGEFVEVDAIPINILELDFFLYRNQIKYWCVVDGITGRRVTKFYKTITLAKEGLNQAIGFRTKSQVEKRILDYLKTTKLSPRYRYIAKPVRKYVVTN